MAVNKALKNAIEKIKDVFNITQSEISEKLGIKSTYLSDMIHERVPLTDSVIENIYELFHIEVLAKEEKKDGKLIPFFDDVSSIGGMNKMVSEPSSANEPTEYVNAGDWFKDATAAIRHYGSSMDEYPSGSIIVLKKVIDKSLLVWGRDYVIETSEYRITKKVQKSEVHGCIRAYSTNKEIYPDGRLVHEPLDVELDKASFYQVLGYVVKKNGGTLIFNK